LVRLMENTIIDMRHNATVSPMMRAVDLEIEIVACQVILRCGNFNLSGCIIANFTFFPRHYYVRNRELRHCITLL